MATTVAAIIAAVVRPSPDEDAILDLGIAGLL